MRFRAEAEVRWLDHCEAALLRRARRGPPTYDGGGSTRTPAQHPIRRR
jgi:hypothetical protein